MKYEIQGGNLPVVICTLEAGEAMTNQGGSMAWMSPNMSMQTEGGGSFGKALGRMFSGEKIFRNIYTAQGGEGMIAFASSFPGNIVALEVTDSHPIIFQKSAFLASTMGVTTEVFFNKKFGAGLFGGEGFIMQKAIGNGIVFLEIDGSAVSYALEAGQQMLIDTGSLAIMDASCSLDIQTVKGAKNVLFGGEGLFLTVVTGPGNITLQTMPLSEFAKRLAPYMQQYMPSGGDSSSGATITFGSKK
ncbi:MAG: AIM24 family protein [Clostridia bacterium]|nr:AIM24 family protein [Clostridia bacterium]